MTDKNCQCLAAWIDTAECVCGEPVGNPAPLDQESVERASRLMKEIAEIDRSIPDFRGDRSRVHIFRESTGNHPSRLEVHIPKDFALAIARYARAVKYDELRRTQIVSSPDTNVRQIISFSKIGSFFR